MRYDITWHRLCENLGEDEWRQLQSQSVNVPMHTAKKDFKFIKSIINGDKHWIITVDTETVFEFYAISDRLSEICHRYEIVEHEEKP